MRLNIGLHFDSVSSGYDFRCRDIELAGDVNDRKSRSAYVFMVVGAAVKFCSRKKRIIATSSREAKYVAMSFASKKAICLKRLLSNIALYCDLSSGRPVSLDRQRAMNLAFNQPMNRRNEHNHITYHFVRKVIINE